MPKARCTRRTPRLTISPRLSLCAVAEDQHHAHRSAGMTTMLEGLSDTYRRKSRSSRWRSARPDRPGGPSTTTSPAGGQPQGHLRKPMRCSDCPCLRRYLRLHCSTCCPMLVREMYVSCDVLSGLARRLTEHVARSALLKRGLERDRCTGARLGEQCRAVHAFSFWCARQYERYHV